MTESEWLTSTDPVAMLAHLGVVGLAFGEVKRSPLASDRKLRLFAAACFRRGPGFVGRTAPGIERVPDLAEALADGEKIDFGVQPGEPSVGWTPLDPDAARAARAHDQRPPHPHRPPDARPARLRAGRHGGNLAGGLRGGEASGRAEAIEAIKDYQSRAEKAGIHLPSSTCTCMAAQAIQALGPCEPVPLHTLEQENARLRASLRRIQQDAAAVGGARWSNMAREALAGGEG